MNPIMRSVVLAAHSVLPAAIGPDHPDRVPVARSNFWPRCQKHHLQKQPECQACGEDNPKLLNVHHVEPFWLHIRLPEIYRVDRELEESNLITLCESHTHNCHFAIGHFINWKRWNFSVAEMAKAYRDALRTSIDEAKRVQKLILRSA